MFKRNAQSRNFVFYNARIIILLVCCTLFFCQRSAWGQFAENSVLSENPIYKISTIQNGVHILTYSFLQQDLGIDLTNIDPRNIHIYGNGGGTLPENIDDPRFDDLVENAITIIGEEDGQFDPEDYILFYGQSPETKTWNQDKHIFESAKNIYSDKVYYFIKADNQQGKRVTQAQISTGASYLSNDYDRFDRFEEEKVNLLDNFSGASGTGQNWYGDLFSGTRERNYDFPIGQINTDETATFKVVFAARSGSTSSLEAEVEGQAFSRLIGGVNLTDVEGRYARNSILEGSFSPQDELVNIKITFPNNGTNNIGWLDYIDVNSREQLVFQNTQLSFSDHRSRDHDVSQFVISDVSSASIVWDITIPTNPFLIESEIVGSDLSFNYPSRDLKEFALFSPSLALIPFAEGPIENQNLHGISAADLIVVYHPDLIDAADLFAQHRSFYSDIDVQTVSTQEIFNEFGSGAPDPIAIRDFAKMAYERIPEFKYLLLLGDASFDYKNINDLSNPSNLVPTYETKESLDPIRGFPSDDFFGLLSSGEGMNLKGALDIAIGRLPAKTNQEALEMVHKIISYETDTDRFGEWINKITFVADDEDFNIHLNQADQIAEKLIDDHPLLNIEKIYLDAFKQVSTSGGELYPEVQTAINNGLFKGTSVINYMGHGGSTGFAQERILTINDVNNWNNEEKLALFVTATCSFTGFDDPDFVTAGERAILNPNGGAIALFTTVRAVYSSSNERLTAAVFDNLYEPVNGEIPPLGEILRRAKNSNAADTLGINARKFLLIGDPSMKLIRPRYEINTTQINGEDIGIGAIDTIKALESVTIKGNIDDNGSIKSDFNGTLSIIIFDKARTITTLGQDNTSFERPFDTRKNIIFKGSASVVNGEFEFSFIVPKDIDYQFGRGKVSYYAKSENGEDAAGFLNDLIIGGTSNNGLVDDQGPEVLLYLDNENFQSGGITGPDPTLIIQLSDDYGINIVGNSIGHDITAVLDEDTRNTIILNEFYESELDNTKAGTIRFPLSDLKEGQHSIKVKAWDIANNSGSATTEFIVASDITSAFNQILNYPNPVLDQTTFRIDHNISGGLLDIIIDIFSVDGKLVQTLNYSRGSSGGLIDGLQWDAKDNSGRKLNTGIYLFNIKIFDRAIPDRNASVSNLEKLVILR